MLENINTIEIYEYTMNKRFTFLSDFLSKHLPINNIRVISNNNNIIIKRDKVNIPTKSTCNKNSHNNIFCATKGRKTI